ncbi:MAG: methyltransferase domain-containing protein [Aliifodinibius sp.]|nr:class I SAM-dependent methyltransferase [candidate division Zixibacteria bacterium]NIT57212.1 class I SAM-dependent methyltransferase [Fodinibius sp.]NIW40168.1 methyltransferase domain-containing protein [candidate division Zixibacteria bacterium]NIX56287.1 methyltransferase domain-containing protein [candidate division Zixibacteria bacterium]NIY25794.1 methyltransferase domain-containing protein [Fodinibius sp.]
MNDIQRHDRWKRSGLRTYNGKWADDYDSCLWWRFFSAQNMDKAVVDELSRFNPNLRILDVGCATGRLLKSLARNGLHDLYGMDIAPRIVATAKRRLKPLVKDIDLQVGDAEEKIPWLNNTFDVITATGVLHHFANPKSALKEIYRVLKPKGQLIIIDPKFFSPIRQIINLFLKIHPLNGDFHFYSLKGVTSLLKKCNFNIVKCKQYSWCMYIVIGEKLL